MRYQYHVKKVRETTIYIMITFVMYLNPEPYYTDCKEWYANGSTTSGVYTINPDEGTPFEVSVLVVLKLSSNIL